MAKYKQRQKRKSDALLCTGETPTQRLSFVLEHAGLGRIQESQGSWLKGWRKSRAEPRHMATLAQVCARQRRREKNTPSYRLVHFYPLKQFQHCFKIVLSRVIVLCMSALHPPVEKESRRGPDGSTSLLRRYVRVRENTWFLAHVSLDPLLTRARGWFLSSEIF